MRAFLSLTHRQSAPSAETVAHAFAAIELVGQLAN